MNYQELHEKYVAPTYGNRDLTIIRGEGVYLYDDNKKKYLDCFSNIGVNLLGHNVKEINKSVEKQLTKLTNLHGSFVNDQRSLYAEKIIQKSPDMSKVFFCNSGSEAVEAALKFSRLATGKTEIIAARMGYHGKTIGALSLTKTMKKYNEPYEPLLQNVKHFSYNDVESLKEIISEKTAAVFLEPIQGEGGIKIADKDFFVKVKKLCDENTALLVIDEIQTFGRTGKLFAIEHFNVKPDMICLAKGIASGVPMGVVLITNEISEKLFSGCHTNTFGGSPLVCSAGLATLHYIEQNDLLRNASEVGNYFLQELKKINSPLIREVRGLGLMIAIELKTKSTKYAKLLQEEGVIVIPTLANILRLLPPITFSKENVDEVIPILKKVLNT